MYFLVSRYTCRLLLHNQNHVPAFLFLYRHFIRTINIGELSQDDYDNWRYNFPNIQPTAGFVRNPVSDELDVELQKTLNKEMKEPGLL